MESNNGAWSRRVNNGKLSLSTGSNSKDASKTDAPSSSSNSKKNGGTTPSHNKPNPFNNISSAGNASLASPSIGGSSAFGLGSGAFASFGSNKTSKAAGAEPTAPPSQEKDPQTTTDITTKATTSQSESKDGPLRYTWTFWHRAPTAKSADYEKSLTAMFHVDTLRMFMFVYTRYKRPSELPLMSEYLFFRKGIRPAWEDEENRRGGKFIIRLKKGVAGRLWENLLFALVGNQITDAEEVTGAVLSMRNGEDVISVWTKYDGGKNARIRQDVKRLMELPQDTVVTFKSHDASIAQRTALDEARREKASGNSNGPGHLKRRDTLSAEDSHLDDREE